MSDFVTNILAPKTNLHLNVGLYFGSFNPVHIGHLAIANYMVEFTDIDQLWFVVSPQNPNKKKTNLLDDYQRLELVHRAVGNDNRLRASNIEFSLPRPSYTIDTLTYLKDQYPDYSFTILMGSDNLEYFHKWKNYEAITKNYHVIVYPRPGFNPDKIKSFSNITMVNAPLMEISSTFIRNSIKEGKNIKYFLPQKVFEYIEEMNFYKK
jgi:nicotinate-nucleotide adenylyltransferase